MIEAQWRPSASVFQRLSGEGFVMTVDEAENSEVISSADLPFFFPTHYITQSIWLTTAQITSLSASQTTKTLIRKLENTFSFIRV